jgi:hypothetical protein
MSFTSYFIWTFVIKAQGVYAHLGWALEAYKHGCNGFSMNIE